MLVYWKYNVEIYKDVENLQSNLYISIPYTGISIASLLALPPLAQFWDYGQNSMHKTSLNA